MTDKKARVAPTRKKTVLATSKPSGKQPRRKYTEGNQAQCSVDKRGSLDTAVLQKAQPNQSKFVHQASKSRPSESSDHSKPATDKQVACKKWFKRINAMGLHAVRKEYITEIKKYLPELPMTAFNDEANTSKNRYDDVFLLDATRVKITINPDGDDYIHASRVEVRPDLVYICAQGPLLNTIAQFWLMIIQEDVKIILQLCQNIEDEKEKCNDYLPKEIGKWTNYGPVQIKVMKVGPIPATKKVTRTLVRCKFEDKEFIMCHLLYYGWPDHGVPESTPTCREVQKLVQAMCEKKPIVVHCSAGIGRTGTFVAIEMVCNKLLNECDGDFDMVELMQGLRLKRYQSIQNDQQYSFVFRATIECLVAEEGLAKSPEVAKFIQTYEEMIARKKKQRNANTSKRA